MPFTQYSLRLSALKFMIDAILAASSIIGSWLVPQDGSPVAIIHMG